MGLKEIGFDSVINLVIIALFVIEIFCTNPVLVGFLRLRCILRFPLIFMLVTQHCNRKVNISPFKKI